MAAPDPDADGRPFRRRVLVNGATTVAGNGWSILLTLVTYPLVLEGLGVTAFGVWALLQTFSAFTGWASLADLGVVTASHHHLARRASVGDDAGAGRVAAGVLGIVAAGGLVAAGLLAVVGAVALPVLVDVPDELVSASRTAAALFAAQLAVDAATRGAQAVLEGLNRIDVARGLDALRRTVGAVATAVAAQGSGGLVAVAAASLVASVPFAPLGLLLVRRHLRGPLRWSRPEAVALLRFGRGALLLRSTGVLHRSMDRLVVGVALGPGAVAVVDAATQVQMGAEAVFGASSYAVTPAASWLDARRDPQGLRSLAVTGTRLCAVITLPFVVVPAVLAGPLVGIWLGDAGAGVAHLVPLALGYTLLNVPVQVLSNLMVGVGRVGSVVRPAVAAVVVNLVLTVVLVGPLGPEGAFLASLVGAAVLVPPLLLAGCAAVDVPVRSFLAEACRTPFVGAAAAAAAAGVVLALPLGDLVTVAVGGVAGFVAHALVTLPAVRASRGAAALQEPVLATDGAP